ncbi:MAG TPA: ABC transporter permease [Candidatus Acidoferrum sp.]|nr:ABC transporter permease [Candidatus Acidoferrum sp.]
MLWSFLCIAREALRVVRRFLLRSALIVLASGFGIAAVTLSVNFAAAGRRAALSQIARMGPNILTLTPQQDRGKGVRSRTGDIVHTLVPADYIEIRQRLPRLAEGSPVFSGQYRIKAGDLSKTAQVVGCLPSYPVMKAWRLRAGEWFSSDDNRRAARVAVLGAQVARDIFGDTPPVGQQLSIERSPFIVIGIVEEHGQGLDAVSEDDQVYVPLQTAMHRLSNVDYYTGMLLQVRGVSDVEDAVSNLTALLRSRHRRLANLPDDFQVRNQKTLLETQAASARQLALYVRVIGIAGLAVSGLGILAILWIAVKARTTEIGTRRALGATTWEIFTQILFEAALLSAPGSLTGLALGYEGTRIATWQGHLPFGFDPATAYLAVALAIFMNLACAVFPAFKAARVSPIAALRFE